MLVRNEMNSRQKALFEKYKDEILFIGISSFEDFPLPSVNPFSPKYAVDAFTGLLPAWLHMMRPPDALKYFPPHVKVLLLSQSDFSLPYPPKRDYSVKKKNQDQFFNYMKQARFQFLPQIHDASPRVAAQAMMHDLPLLMNAHISGGWKYMTDHFGDQLGGVKLLNFVRENFGHRVKLPDDITLLMPGGFS
eukprot:gene14796-7959_t